MRGRPDVCLVQRCEDVAGYIDTLLHGPDVTALYQGRRRGIFFELALLQAAAHVENVAKPFGGDKPGIRAVAGQGGIGGNGGAVDDGLHLLQERIQRHAVLQRRFFQAPEKPD